MFIPCDHCLRKRASHTVLTREDGRVERLYLCDGCYRRHRENSTRSSDLAAHELSIAAALQEDLLPRRVPEIPGYDVSAYFRPASKVGGDYYDFIEIDKDHLGFVVADISGAGIPGTIVMT